MNQLVSIGDRFGRLTVAEILPRESKAERQLFRCACDCGGERVCLGQSIRVGRTLSCGCLRSLKVFAPKTFSEKVCIICGSGWTPKTWAQAQRNSTCGQKCKAEFISAKRRRSLHALELELKAKSTPQPDGCITWTGPSYRDGYARICRNGRLQMAHRVAYEIAKGPIPQGLCLDHLCRVRSCINPEHLEPVTHQENVRRGARASQTHCLRGHPFDDENTRYLATGGRVCRACADLRRQTRKSLGKRS